MTASTTSLRQPEPGRHRYPLATAEMRKAEAAAFRERDRAYKAIKPPLVFYSDLELEFCRHDHGAAQLYSALAHQQRYFSDKRGYSGWISATILPGEKCRHSLHALCRGRMSERQLVKAVEVLMELGLLLRRNNPENPMYRQYQYRICPEASARAYRAFTRKGRGPAAGADVRRGQTTPKAAENTVSAHSDNPPVGVHPGVYAETASQTAFSGSANGETACFRIPANAGSNRKFFSYRVLSVKEGNVSADDVALDARGKALRARPALEPEQQQPSEPEAGDERPEVGGPASLPPAAETVAHGPAARPPMEAGEQNPPQRSAAPCNARSGSALGGENQTNTRRTDEHPHALSQEPGAFSPGTEQAANTALETGEKEGGADDFLAALIESEGGAPVSEAAWLAQWDARASTPPPFVRAAVSAETRGHAELSVKGGVWRFPVVDGLLERPLMPASFEENLRNMAKALRRERKTRPEDAALAVQVDALDAVVGNPGWWKETPNQAETWRRIERWGRLTPSEVDLAVEFVPRLRVTASPATTLMQLLDRLCGARMGAEGTRGAAESGPAWAEWRPGSDRRVLEAEAEAARRHEAEQRALEGASAATQWEHAGRALQMVTRGILDDATFRALEARCRAGALSAAALLRELPPLRARPDEMRARLAACLG